MIVLAVISASSKAGAAIQQEHCHSERAFGARNLHFRNSRQLQIPRYARKNKFVRVSPAS
jgi:hypothetical protein